MEVHDIFWWMGVGILSFLLNAFVGAAILSWIDAKPCYHGMLHDWFSKANHVFGLVVGNTVQMIILQLWFVLAAVCFWDMRRNNCLGAKEKQDG